MRIPRNLIWLVFILASLFFWCVVFEYGWDPKNFTRGAKEELSRAFAWLARRLGA
jgi:hypothetical protein